MKKRQSKTAKTTTFTATKKQFAQAFAEWDRRYREEPESFMHEVRHLLGETSGSYGRACAEYFSTLLADT